MLDAVEKFQAAFEKLKDEDPSYMEFFYLSGPPCSTDWEKTRAFVIFLKSFYEATKLFSSPQEVSLHLAFHNLSAILCKLQEASLNMNTYVAPMNDSKVLDLLEEYDITDSIVSANPIHDEMRTPMYDRAQKPCANMFIIFSLLVFFSKLGTGLHQQSWITWSNLTCQSGLGQAMIEQNQQLQKKLQIVKSLESGLRNDAPDSAIAMRQKWLEMESLSNAEIYVGWK
ncbi:hypothetical protein KIW84_030867 [Lathyrus oleraceus]|uniref:Uncharacterized protein n=1 Tax=Pisum sativum TaxID=3888 RepID=A0A9D4XQV1_PEA|nr:hypothetical protein KIW84_030867 [Pisum sativum]